MSLRIRDFDPANDKIAALSFILGSQHYERALEPDRRIDLAVADDHYAVLMKDVTANAGRVFVAETEGRAAGWAVFVVAQAPAYVVEDQRTHGYIAELFVDESTRGLGVGRALIAACEDEARARGLGHMTIGVLTASRRTAEIYARAGYAPYTSELRKYLT